LFARKSEKRRAFFAGHASGASGGGADSTVSDFENRCELGTIKTQKIQVIYERERGRENGSFPVVEILKPQGFKESAAADDVRVLSWAQKK